MFHLLPDETGSVDIEFVGDPPMLDDITRLRIAMGDLPHFAAEVLRDAEASRVQAVKGVTKRIVDPEYFGTSRQYVFGPSVFIVAVEARDVDKIMGSSSGHQFRIVGDPGNDVIRPAPNVMLVSTLEGSINDVFR